MTGDARIYWWNGLVIASPLPLDRLPLAAGSSREVELSIQRRDPVPLPAESTSATIQRRAAGARLTAPGVGSFLIEASARRIVLTPAASGLEDWKVADWLLQSALPIYATLRGHVCVHAVAVSHRAGHATLWVGPSGVGKSAAGAVQIDAGAELVADDVVLLHPNPPGVRVGVGSQTLRLRPDVAHLVADSAPLPRPAGSTKTQFRLPHPDPAEKLDVERIAVREQLEQPWTPVQSEPGAGLRTLCRQVLDWELMDLDGRRRTTELLFGAVAALSSEWDPASMSRSAGSDLEV
jgi:hypothetical protein